METNFRYELELLGATREETMLLHQLGENLMLQTNHVQSYHKAKDKVILDLVFNKPRTQEKATLWLCNALRMSKNYAAHICAITAVENY